MDGEAGNDLLNGSENEDTLLGGAGQDTLLGQNGADSLFGGSDRDWLEGGANKDTLFGGLGDDTLLGGDSQDVFILASGNGVDTLLDFSATGGNKDLLGLSGGLTFAQIAIAPDINPANTLIKVSATNELLAILPGVPAATINSSHFLTL